MIKAPAQPAMVSSDFYSESLAVGATPTSRIKAIHRDHASLLQKPFMRGGDCQTFMSVTLKVRLKHLEKGNRSVPLLEKEGIGEIVLNKSPSIPLFQKGR